jgi:hypothetical protein
MMNRVIRLLFAALAMICLTSCAARGRQEVLVLAYQDFGPQMLAREVLGMEWWQWEDHGDSSPEARYDVKVAVYREMPLEDVKKQYPVLPEQRKDFRYVEYKKALQFLDEKIQENVMEDVTDALKVTRKKITETLGE